MYKNYIFDLYGTLVDIHTDEEQMLLWNKLSAFYRFQGANYTAKELKARYASLVKEALQAPSPYLYKDIQIETVFQSLYTEKGIQTNRYYYIPAKCSAFFPQSMSVFMMVQKNYYNG